MATEDKPLTRNVRADGEAVGLKDYLAAGGYRGLRAALAMSPQEVQAVVEQSALRGRGGAGFPTAQKWSFVPMGAAAAHPKYLVANADEMEPGAFKDRLLLEADPHQLLEGMAIAAYAIEADIAYVFVRWAYRLAARRLTAAIAEAEQAGYLGENILGSGYSLRLHLHVSAGRYICGEETALLNALEGRRANPRAKPPYPQTSGLWGKPTIVNNVETLCNLPHILSNGAAWYRSLSRSEDAGTKLYGVSGRVKRPGLWELPMGTPLAEIIEEHAGGMTEGYRLRAVLPGGASTDFLGPEKLAVAMDFASVQQAGSRLGTGTAIVLDDRTCPIGLLANIEHFFAQESCGWCTPCWSGLSWVEEILRRFENGAGHADDLDILAQHGLRLGPGHTFCALAPGAAEPLLSGLRLFRSDFLQHIDARRCPWS